MIIRVFLLLGFALCVVSGLLLFFLFHLPERSMSLIPLVPQFGKVPLAGGGPGAVPLGDYPLSDLRIEEEWPSNMDLNSSDDITVKLSALQDIHGTPTPTPIPTTETRSVMTATPFPFSSDQNSISGLFGDGYSTFAVVHLYATTFDLQPVGQEEQSLDDLPSAEWNWNITPKALGTHVVNVDIECIWKPLRGSGANKVRQMWQSRMIINVGQPFFDKNQLTLGVLVTGVLGSSSIFLALLNWLGGQISKIRIGRQNKKNSQLSTRRQDRLNTLVWEHIEMKGRKRRKRRKVNAR